LTSPTASYHYQEYINNTEEEEKKEEEEEVKLQEVEEVVEARSSVLSSRQ